MSGMEEGKVAILGFALSCRLQKMEKEDAARMLDTLDAELELRGLVMGGGIDADRLDVFILPHKETEATDSDRLALAEWLDRQPSCTEVAVSDWVDAYGVE